MAEFDGSNGDQYVILQLLLLALEFDTCWGNVPQAVEMIRRAQERSAEARLGENVRILRSTLGKNRGMAQDSRL